MRIRATLSLALVVLAGCSSKPESTGTDVTGTVSNAGQPVTDAIIYFENPQTAYSVWAALNEKGEYRNPNLPPGKYQVAVRPKPQAPAADDPNTEPTDPMPLTHPLVPAKFHSSETSGLTVEVQPGAAVTLDFDLGK